MEKVILTFDEFFKISCKEFFESFGFIVKTEYEIFKQPKRLDVLVIEPRKKKNFNFPSEFQLLSYWKLYNLISFKSTGDRIKIKDINDAVIYYLGYLGMEKSASTENTTMTLLANHAPKKFLKNNHENITILAKGHYLIDYNQFNINLINLSELEMKTADELFLLNFGPSDKIGELLRIMERFSNKIILDRLKTYLYNRIRAFEPQFKEIIMPGVLKADITEIVRPHYENGMKKGIEKGIEQGKLEDALKMHQRGMPLADILEITGLTKIDLIKAGLIS